MILGELPDILKRYGASIRERQWATWELLSIVAVAVIVLLLVIFVLRRLKQASARRKSVRMIAGEPGLTDKQRIRLLQREIIKRDNTEAHVEREISELGAANKELRVKIAELTKVSDQLRQTSSKNELSAMQKVTELVIVCEQLRREVTAGREARESSAREIASLIADNRQLEGRVNELSGANEQFQRQVGQIRESSERKIAELVAANEQLQTQLAELTRANEQLRQEVEAGKKSREGSERKIAELATANEQLQAQLAELTRANEQLGQEMEAGKETREGSERKIAELVAANERLQAQLAELTRANEQLGRETAAGKETREGSERKIAELISANEKLQQDIAAGKKAVKSSEEKISALTVANEQLQDELAEYMRAAGKEVPDRHSRRVSPDERMMLMSEIGVKAKSPAQQLRELAEEVVESKASDTPDARRQAIQDACDYLDADNKPMAVEALKKFIEAVEARQSSNGNIAHKEEADDWIGAAREVIYQLTAE